MDFKLAGNVGNRVRARAEVLNANGNLEVLVDLLDMVDAEAEVNKRRTKVAKASKKLAKLEASKHDDKEALEKLRKELSTYSEEMELLSRLRTSRADKSDAL